MRLFRSGDLLGIARETMQFILEACEESHPDEYMGFLRSDDARKLGLDRDGQVITDVLVIPGTVSNPVSATVKTNMKPNDIKSVGSVHSHPNGVLQPSDADLDTFGQGDVHIIAGAPYGWRDWKAFDSHGDPISLDIIDVELPEEHFFDFTQEDIDAELAAENADITRHDRPNTDADTDADIESDKWGSRTRRGAGDHGTGRESEDTEDEGGGFLSWFR
ncbi:MAG: proteasome Rpn11 subunit JAMM motif metallopeptidase, MEROPS family M67B [uncultured archaeon A07HR60]|nr:MAG: proteasome Rpn11 subunit JAMM motif metallopeptidase, MEROPS family M67B [uncultured archaeon A07HR60]